MIHKWQKILSLFLAIVILMETSITPVSAVETAVDGSAGLTTEDISALTPTESEAEPASIVGEVEELRDECSKQFLMSDGTFSLVEYETDVHYQDESGHWQEIDNTLSAEGAEDSSDETGYSTKEGLVKFKFAKNPNANYLLRLQQGKYHLFFSLQNTQKKAAGAKILTTVRSQSTEEESLPEQFEAEHVKSGVTYQDILPGTDVEYITSGSSLKENIIVKEKQDAYQYTFEIKTNKLDVKQEEDGSISFRTQDSGELLYTIPAMYMTDANGQTSDQVSFQLSTKNKKSTLVITADAGWINAEERVFPVTIDPTLESTNKSTGNDTRVVRNQYVTERHPSTPHSGYGKGFLGYDSSNDGIYHLFVQFKSLPELPADSVILSSKFYYAQSDYSYTVTPTLTVAAYAVEGAWSWGTNLTWNNQPNYSSTVLDYQVLSSSTVGQYVGWDVTPLLKTHYEDKDHSNDSSAFMLTAINESSLSNSNCAKATVIQENSSGYFTGAQPVLVITYRSTRGLEDYYTYQTQDLGRAGTAYIGDYTKELTVVRTDISTTSTAMPFQISHIYNSSFSDQNFTASADVITKNYDNMRVGKGWKLNIQETIVEKTIGNTKYLIYNDSDGTTHYCPLSSGNTYKDEDGLKLTIVKSTNPDKYTMRDEQGNQKIFYNGYLSSILDANGNAIHILYNGAETCAGDAWYANTGSTNRVTKVIQQNNGQNTPVTIATFGYVGKHLRTMTDFANRVYKFNFTASATDSTGKALDYNLTQIVDPDGSYAQYDYYLVSSHGVNKLARTRDSQTMLGGRYTYRVTNQASKLNRYQDIYWTSSSQYSINRAVDISNTELLQVYYRDQGLDCTALTADDIWTYCTFDNAGRTVCQASLDRTRSAYYGATATAYSQDNTSARANKVLNHITVGTNGVNLLPNGGAENGSSGWTLKKYTSTEDNMAVAVTSSGYIRSGNRSFHIAVNSAAAADSSGRLLAQIYRKVSLTAGKTYTFSGYFKNTLASGFSSKSQAYLQVNDPNATRLALSTVITSCTSPDIEDGWARLSATFTAPADGDYTLIARTSWIYGRSCFDDLQLEEGSSASGYNLLVGGDAEWADDWTFSSGASQSTGHVYGEHNIKIVGSPTEKRSASVTVPLNMSSNNTFVLSGWATGSSVPISNKEDSSERAFGMEATLTYGDGTTETHYVSFDSSSGHLQYASGNIVPKRADTTLKSAKISCIYNKNANTAFFDNLSFRKEPVACYSYDKDGNLVAANANGQDKLDFQYSAGNLIKETSPSNGTYTYTYDAKHHLISATNDGVQMTLAYDDFGHVTATKVKDSAQTNAAESRSIYTSATYSEDGDYLLTQTGNLGEVTTYTTNAIGLTSSVTDALKHKTSYLYDNNNNRLTQVSLDDGTSVQYTYNKDVIASIVRSSLLPGGTTKQTQTYSFTYDLYGNVTAVKVGSTILVRYAYMAHNGPLTKITYGNGYTIEYGYDPLGRIVTEKRDGVLKYRYVYGSEGDLSRKEELNSSGIVVKATCYEYDSLDRLVRSWEETRTGSYLKRGLITQHLYDTSNRLTGQSWQLTDGTSKTETYTYNSKDGTLSSMKTASGRTLSLTYDYLKRLSERNDGNYTLSYDYSFIGNYRTSTQVSDLTWTGPGSANWALHYTYDKLGNITQVTENGAVIAQYTYDAQSQLIKEVLPQSGLTYVYSYDTAGNLRSAETTANGATDTKTYRYTDSSWKDLLTSMDGHEVSYDKCGNPSTWYTDAPWKLVWDEGRQLDRIIPITSYDENDKPEYGDSICFTYDAEGLRTSKTVDGVPYDYTYLGNKLVRQSWGGNTIHFAYDDQGRPYSLNYNGNVFYYILNLQGDVVRIVNSAGVVRAEYTYNAWGELLEAEGALATINPLWYRGYVYDQETGLYYLNSRYYDPANRRFVNADEFSNADTARILSTNTFAYCENNPVSRSDPEGKFFNTVVGAVVGGVIGGISAALEGGDISRSIISGAVSGGVAGFGVDVAVAIVGTGPVGIVAAGATAFLSGFGASLVGDAIDQGKNFEFSKKTAGKAVASGTLNVLSAGIGAGLNKAFDQAFNQSKSIVKIAKSVVTSTKDLANRVIVGVNAFAATHTTIIGRMATRFIGQLLA